MFKCQKWKIEILSLILKTLTLGMILKIEKYPKMYENLRAIDAAGVNFRHTFSVKFSVFFFLTLPVPQFSSLNLHKVYKLLRP